jgi:Tfp pilus assembly protein PilW
MELLVAMAVFMIIGGAAFSLVRRHVPLFANQQNQAGLNITLRNAAAQMQIDVVNAGTGFYTGLNIPAWPVGVTIINNPAGTNCYDAASKTYGATCFDTLNVIATDLATPAAMAANTSAGTGCNNTNLSTALYLIPSGTTAGALAARYKTGDQILLVKNDGSQMTTTVLTSDASVVGSTVKITHNITNADGTNSIGNDPLAITNTADSGVLGVQFCPTDFVLKLAPITYYVDASNNTNPKLMRLQNGTANVVSEQIVGFKVGASIWNGSNDQTYDFDASHYNHNWSAIRSVRISLIGRTGPNPNGNFQNTFDGGNYKVEAVSVVVNPRNLSMND